jgi:tetratricopeptide (TPR) repeat protein
LDAAVKSRVRILAGILALCVLCLKAPLPAAQGSQAIPASTPAAVTVNASSIEEATAWVEEGKRSFQATPLMAAAAVLTAGAKDPDAGFDCSYQAARAYLYLSYVLELAGHKSQARDCLDPAMRWARTAVALRPSSAGAHCVLAEVYGRRVLLGDAFTALRYGPLNGSETAAAVRLAPDDPQVLEAQGLRFLYAPALFGGNPALAQRHFEDSLKRADSDYVRYFLALALAKEGKATDAHQALLQAHAMNPSNALVNTALAAETSR